MIYRLGIVLAAFSCLASARVSSIEIAQRTNIPAGYEKVIGTVHFAIDPKLPANQNISDIKYAPVNAQGMVEFSADVYILKPVDPAKSNHAVFFEVSNRGGKSLMNTYNRASNGNEFGDQFLMEQGYTVVWLGWEADLPTANANLVRLHAPVATDHGKPITGLVLSEFIPETRTTRMHLNDREMVPYPVIEGRELTVRDTITGPRKAIAKQGWLLKDGTDIIMEAGFEPGKIYEFVYTAKDPILAGFGPTGVRDLMAFLKYGGNDATALGDEHQSIKQIYGYGVSQSGRFLRKYLYDGFNADEQGRKVFDGLVIHVAGGGMGSFNHRFAQPSRDGHPFMNSLYPTDVFPFTDLPETDPATGATDALLARAVKANVVPKIFYTNSSYEYWGRAASLIHTTPDGKGDAKLLDTTRVYMFAGGQHSPVATPRRTVTLNPTNPDDYTWMHRALLNALDAWVKTGTVPPDSVYPKIADGTLVALNAVKFPAIPGQRLPQTPRLALRMDFGPEFQTEHVATVQPPKLGDSFPIRVPQVDADGIDMGGIRMPEVAFPLATYTGWNLRAAALGATEQLYAMQGSFLPFALTSDQAAATHDPRPSISTRYPGKDAYVAKVRAEAEALVGKRFLLKQDVEPIVRRAGATWDLVHDHPSGVSD
jgi:hypothetical protein